MPVKDRRRSPLFACDGGLDACHGLLDILAGFLNRELGLLRLALAFKPLVSSQLADRLLTLAFHDLCLLRRLVSGAHGPLLLIAGGPTSLQPRYTYPPGT